MGAGVAELKDQLVEVKKQLATAPESVELLEQRAVLEAELQAAQAKKSADSAAAGAWCFLSSCHARPTLFLRPSPCISHNTRYDAFSPLPFMQARRRRLRSAWRT